jgi:hypothetical protein
LTDDQKAMLRLLAQREEGYDDMAALMGISVEEVRARVKEALAEVEEPPATEEESPPEPPPPPAPKPPEPVAPPEPPPAVAEDPPQDVPAARAKPAEKARPAKSATQIPSLKVPKDRGALIGLGAGALVVVILVIVLIAGGDGGGESSSTATPGESNLAENASASAESENLTQAVLSPSDGGDASGRAVFGRLKKKVLLQVTAEGLEPSGQGETYTIWLYRSPKIALQIGSVPVGDSGKLAAQFEIPVQLLTYVANGSFDQIDVARTSTAEYKAAFTKAKKESRVPPYVGESVLRGEITSPAIESQ